MKVNELDACEECGKEFAVGDEVVENEHGYFHFNSLQNCFEEYCFHQHVDRIFMVESDNEDDGDGVNWMKCVSCESTDIIGYYEGKETIQYFQCQTCKHKFGFAVGDENE